MFKRNNYLAPGVVTLVAAVLLSLPSGAASRVKLATGGLFAPFFGAANAVGQLPGAALDAVMPRGRLLRDMGNLRLENQRLEAQNLQAAALLDANNQLRAQLGWQKQSPWKLKLAGIILRDPANWWRTVEINLGSRDGIRENLPVLTRDGLVGRVSFVGHARSQVVLVGDPRCRVSARVANPGRDLGIVTTGGPLDASLVNLTYLSGDAKLESGQKVVTSGEGGIFPAGIPIGEIVDSSQVENGLYGEARVKLSANLGSLDQVWVLTNPQVLP
jgi:rod shape-determining protein MreC